MNEYMRVWDSSDELTDVNTFATSGWRVIASFNDERRGQMFIMERELTGLALMRARKEAEDAKKPHALPADYAETAK